MNVLFLLRLWPVYGGGETVTVCLANEMVKRGWNVHVLYFKDHTRDVLPFIDPRIVVHQLKNVDCDEFTANLDESNRVNNCIKQLVDQMSIDAVINQWYPVEYIKGLKGGRAKIVNCLHTAFYIPIFESYGAKGLLKKMFSPVYLAKKKRESVRNVLRFLPYVDKYVFLSPAFKQQFIEFSNYSFNTEVLEAVPNPLVYDCSIAPEKLAKKRNEVLFVGRMVEGTKRVSLALKIWHEIEKEDCLKDWHFTLVGDGPDLKSYKSLANSLGLERVSFEGFQDPTSYYERAKLFMMTSAFEGFGMTLIEAAQFGVVPVAFDSYLALHDIIVDGRNGRIIPDRNVDMYKNALADLMRNADELERVRLNALADCEKFKVSGVVDMWTKVLG